MAAVQDGHEDHGAKRTLLLVITDRADTAAAVRHWLAERLATPVVSVSGYYAAVAAVTRRCAVVVMQALLDSPREEWQLAGLQAHTGDATVVVVVADEPARSALAGASRAALAVAGTDDLPPLRELVTGPSALPAQPRRRRTPR